MKTEVYICDIKECGRKAIHKDTKLQVIFTTDQTEGRSCSPYLDNVTIDICDECMAKILDGRAIYASGAMGCNEYSIAGR